MWEAVAAVADAAAQGFHLVFSWPNILYPTVATLIAMGFAFVPGIGSVTSMALAMSLTFSWDPVYVLLVFGALTGGGTFAGSITAILFNIPGTSPSAATMIDGYPLTQQGKAKTAIACAATASALGSTVGILLLVLLLPVLRTLILAFGPAEFLMLAIWGLATIAAATGRSLSKGLAMAGLGLLLSFIGFDRRTAEPRFTFGSVELQDGLHIIPLFLGIFAITEVLSMMVANRQTIAGGTALSGSTRDGILSVFQNFWVFLRSAVTGALTGMIPAVGGTVASFLAYGQTVQWASDRTRFGHGDIRGVIAPEAAHDAKDGGSLAPIIAFGIPGNEGTAVLLAALTLHGFVPGREMLSSQLPMVFVLIWSLFYSNWLTSIAGLAAAPILAKLSVVSMAKLAPFILITALVGAYGHSNQSADVLVAAVFGMAGYFLRKHGWPLVPLVTAFVLGPFFETNLRLTLRLGELGRVNPFTRPIVWIFFAGLCLMFALPRLRSFSDRFRSEARSRG